MAVSGNMMKSLLYISLLIVLGCKDPAKQADQKKHVDTASAVQTTKPVDRSGYYITKDTLLLATETGDTLKYSKADFNSIVDTHPELYSGDTRDPDLIYYCNRGNGFVSEAGQDEYYVLYAYFLKQKNGIDKYAARRKKLVDIYENINSLFARVRFGGTYFGHQGLRILGYAEFSIYLYKYYEKDISKAYDISKQKDLYIKSLRLLFSDGSKIDKGSLDKEMMERYKELNTIVDNIDKAITDNFYLLRAQQFQYDYYQYY